MPRKMKESGVEWLGQIPEGWGVCRCKFILCRNDGGIWGNDPVGEDGEFVLRSTEQTIDGNWEVIAPAKRDLSLIPNKEYFLIRAGDLLVTKSSGSDLHIGKTTLADEAIEKGHYYYSNFLQRLRFDGSTAPRFVWYLMNSCIARQQFVYRQNSTSGIGNINAADIDELKFPRPPLPDQRRIAAFLDERCAKIDRMIAEAKASIEDYKKWKQSIIFEAVTGKHEKNLKPSGVDWIGDVPEGWKVCRIVNLYSEVSERGSDELPILSVSINTGVSDKELSEEEQERVFLRSEDRTKYKRVQPGDLTYNMMRAWQGAFGAVRVDGMVSPAYVVARPKVDMDSRYVEYLLRTPNATEEMKRFSHGITDFRLRLYWPEFKDIKIPCPSVKEQKQIADYIDEKCAAIDKLVGEKEALIADLEAYKKSLIFETVTGKREIA